MIAIKNMKNIPKSCSVCGLKSGSYCYHKKPPYDLNGINVLKERASDCPLVEIVTCKECKFSFTTNNRCGCKKFSHEVIGDGYCPYGERRE